VHKKDGKSVRICIDPKFLNKALLREFHPLTTLESVLPSINGSQYFTTLDANMGFFQLQLDSQSQLLTAFNTPWGRYMYLRLPMGITSAPEIFQRAMEELFLGIQNVHTIFDDILAHTTTLTEHCKQLRSVLERARQNNLTFRLAKCRFAKSEVEYTGHILSSTGVKPSASKVKAIIDMPQPDSIDKVRTFLGMATYLSKYIPNFSTVTEPLRQLLKTKGNPGKFYFDSPQVESFNRLKASTTD
jgi:hypothetical protein